MILDLLSKSNYQSYNVVLANKIGLEPSIYLAVLLDIYSKAIKKNKVFNEKYFWVDCEYIKSLTTFDESKQLQLNIVLESFGILIRSEDKKYIGIDTSMITSIVLNSNEEIEKDMSKLRVSANKKSKTDYVLDRTIKHIDSSFSTDVRNAFIAWLEAVMEKSNFVSVKLLENAEQKLCSIIRSEPTAAVNILNIAATYGWKDVGYAIQKYYSSSTTRNFTPVVENKHVQVDTSGRVF